MKVQIGNTEYKVWWKHTHPEVGVKSSSKPPMEERGNTQCYLELAPGKVLLSVAVCSEKDIFNKSKGRKISFARVIRSFPKQERILFWKAYDEQIGLVKKSKKQLQYANI